MCCILEVHRSIGLGVLRTHKWSLVAEEEGGGCFQGNENRRVSWGCSERLGCFAEMLICIALENDSGYREEDELE